MLKDYPKARKIAYIISSTIAGLLTAIQIGFAAANVGQPMWLTISMAVYVFASGYLGVQAATNVTPALK